MNESTLLNRARLRSAVNGDWEPYTTRKRIWIYGQDDPVLGPEGAGGIKGGWIESVETDFDLLRHDIHVLLYEAST